jgi:hypothetical protein
MGFGRRRILDRDPLVTIACVLVLATALILLWRLGVPLPLLVAGLLVTCFVTCLAFMALELRSHRRAEKYLADRIAQASRRPE